VPAELHPAGSGVPVQVVTGSPESVTETVTGPAVVRLFAKRRRRAPVEDWAAQVVVVVAVHVGIGNSTLTWPPAELIAVAPLFCVIVICEAEDMFGALR